MLDFEQHRPLIGAAAVRGKDAGRRARAGHWAPYAGDPPFQSPGQKYRRSKCRRAKGWAPKGRRRCAHLRPHESMRLRPISSIPLDTACCPMASAQRCGMFSGHQDIFDYAITAR